MPINPNSSARIDEFLSELARNDVRALYQSRSLYLINALKVSIRTTTKPGPIFWYDVSASVLDRTDYFIYQTDSKNHFALIQSAYLIRIYDQLMDSNRPKAKQFYIYWKSKKLSSNPAFSESISSHCCSTVPGQCDGKWRSVLRG